MAGPCLALKCNMISFSVQVANTSATVFIIFPPVLRHRRGLPVHGQRTKTNARTRKGPKKTIANKKK